MVFILVIGEREAHSRHFMTVMMHLLNPQGRGGGAEGEVTSSDLVRATHIA